MIVLPHLILSVCGLVLLVRVLWIGGLMLCMLYVTCTSSSCMGGSRGGGGGGQGSSTPPPEKSQENIGILSNKCPYPL